MPAMASYGSMSWLRKCVILAILGTFFKKSIPFTFAKSVENEELSRGNVCTTSECVKAAELIIRNMDKTVNPCDNFYQFACGGFEQKTIILPEEVIGTNLFIKNKLEFDERLKFSIQNTIKDNDLQTFKLLKSHYDTCLNANQTESSDVQLISKIVNELGGWPVVVGDSWNETKFDWKQVIYETRKKGLLGAMNSLISFNIVPDVTNETKITVLLSNAKTWIKKNRLKSGPSGVVSGYYKNMIDKATALGADKNKATIELSNSLLFEIELAQISMINEIFRLKLQDLESNYQGFPWRDYLKAFLEPHIHINPDNEILVNLAYVQRLLRLIHTTDKQTIANYIIWRAIKDLHESMRITGANKNRDWKKCLNYVASKLPLATQALYVRKEFNKTLKNDAQKLVGDVCKSFRQFISEAKWMEPTAKSAAQKKLDFIQVNVAFPDEFLDDNKLENYHRNLNVYSDSLLKSQLALKLFTFGKEVEKIFKTVNRSDWTNHQSTPKIYAQYFPKDNSIDVPAGLLHKGLYTTDRPNYLNYGSIGYIVGHEFTHVFDNNSRQYDDKGNYINWWDPDTNSEYEKRLQCIVNQYNNFTISGKHINNSTETLDENIADVGGIKWAYHAYDELAKRAGEEPRLPQLNYNSRQLFWISAANFWCYKFRPGIDLLSQVHSPGEFRVIGPFSNMPEFSRDFNCSPESPMNPSNKCSIW